jgi:hypothetical protein
MKTLRIATYVASALLLGCASYSGRGLVPGQSTAADVEGLMGKPAERIETPGGGSVLYYPRGPLGRETYAVVLRADGKVQAVEQRLTDENIAKLAAGTTTIKEVRELFGPPSRTASMPRLQRDVWEYPMDNIAQPRVLYVQFSADGIVREVLKMEDYSAEPTSGSGDMP